MRNGNEAAFGARMYGDVSWIMASCFLTFVVREIQLVVYMAFFQRGDWV